MSSGQQEVNVGPSAHAGHPQSPVIAVDSILHKRRQDVKEALFNFGIFAVAAAFTVGAVDGNVVGFGEVATFGPLLAITGGLVAEPVIDIIDATRIIRKIRRQTPRQLVAS